MQIHPTPLPGLYLITPRLLHDERGAFARVFCKQELARVGLTKELVQINHSYNLKKGTFRGLHYQRKPYEEGKLVRCIRGAVWDVVVDIRPDSPAFLQHFAVELSAENHQMLYIAEGLAHGFITLADHSELLYHHTEYYQPEYNTGISVFSEALHIQLPVPISVMSEKDRSYPHITPDFQYL